MKIAIVTTTFLPHIGGAEFVAHYLACAWNRQGHEVAVVHPHAEPSRPPSTDYEVVRLPLLRGSTRFGYHRFPFRQWASRALEGVISTVRPDFVSAHFGYPTAMWLADCRHDVPTLVTCHGRDITRFPWGYRELYRIDALLRWSLNASTRVVAISDTARSLLEEVGVDGERIVSIPNGVDVERFRNGSGYDFRGELGIPRDALLVLSVGREHPQKAFDRGLRAFARVAAARDDVYYVLLGRGTACWAPLARELGIEQRVRFHDGLGQDALPSAYHDADIFLSSSIWELCPLVLLEAMASGLPLVATDISGNRDAIDSGSNGLLVDPDDPGALAEALSMLLADAESRERMRSENLQRSRGYDWAEIARRYLEAA